MANSNLHDEIYRKLSAKLGKPFDLIEKVCRTQWEFTASTIEEGEKKSVRLKYLGIFGVKANRQKHLDGNQKQKEGQSEPSESKDSE